MKERDQRFNAALLKLWRDSCRHIRLEDSAADIERTLREVLLFQRVLVRVIDGAHSQLYSVVEQPPSVPVNDQKRVVSSAELKQLQRWCRSGRILTSEKGRSGVLALLLPEQTLKNVLAIPLYHDSTDAALILIAPPDQPFADADIDMAHRLSEPIAVAVSNHYRIHELASLREAAEAEKGALLRRLGRTDLGDCIIGEATGLRKVMERVHLVAGSDAPVMILGETGSGKELVARALHTRGARAGGPFIRVNCGAIPPELVDSQLFGHEKGAFTGADQTRRGWFERADGGTLFLDEIGELPLEAQVRFLRVLQDGFFERVGSDKPIHVDVRVVAATHRDLAAMVTAGKFREDLWYRVSVFPILLPPLRERRDDIPELAHHFAERAATRFGLNAVSPTPDDIRLLQEYDWPGNIRELGAVIDRAAILGDGKTLAIGLALGLDKSTPQSPTGRSQGHLQQGDLQLVSEFQRPQHSAHKNPSMTAEEPEEDLSMDSASRRHIERVLAMTRGKVEGPGGAAEVLKINPHTLRARMRKLRIPWSKFRP